MRPENAEDRIKLICDVFKINHKKEDEALDDFISRASDEIDEKTIFTSTETTGFLISELSPEETTASHKTAKSRFLSKMDLEILYDAEENYEQVQFSLTALGRYFANDYEDETGDKFDRYMDRHLDKWKECADRLAKRYSQKIHFVLTDQAFFEKMNEMLNPMTKVYFGLREQHNYLGEHMKDEIISELTKNVYPIFQRQLFQNGFNLIKDTFKEPHFVISGAKLVN